MSKYTKIPSISVVIPLYNKQESIVATLQSVLAQTYTDYEVVIVNDGSTDNSAEVVQEFIQASRLSSLAFRLITQPNAGVSAARNRGIMDAKGEYIAFLDGDDLWDEKYLETLHQLICDYPEAGIYGTTSGIIIGKKREREHSVYLNHRGYISNPWKLGSPYSTSAVVVCKTVFDQVGIFDTRMTHGEDIDMWWRILLDYKGAYEDTVLSYYRLDAENSAMSHPIPLETHIPNFIDKYIEARLTNKEFCRYFDAEMLGRLYPYLFDKKYRKEAKSISKKINFRLQKKSLYLRIKFPYLYRLYRALM